MHFFQESTNNLKYGDIEDTNVRAYINYIRDVYQYNLARVSLCQINGLIVLSLKNKPMETNMETQQTPGFAFMLTHSYPIDFNTISRDYFIATDVQLFLAKSSFPMTPNRSSLKTIRH